MAAASFLFLGEEGYSVQKQQTVQTFSSTGHNAQSALMQLVRQEEATKADACCTRLLLDPSFSAHIPLLLPKSHPDPVISTHYPVNPKPQTLNPKT